jgi:Uma2 family endonuclease
MNIPVQIHYPESDGKPMAESDVHRDWMVWIISRLKRLFSGQRVYVSGNLLVYYVEGNPRKSFAPDVFVVKNCDPRRRKIFKIWEEGKGPNFIMETTSDTTKREDQVTKKQLYAKLRVPEYFLFDPLGDWLNPPLQGLRLNGADYVSIEPDAQGGIASEELGITFKLEEGKLAMFETASGKRLLSDVEHADEEGRRADAEQQRARTEKRRAQTAKRQAQAEKERAEAEALRAAAAAQRAAAAQGRAEEAEQALAREITRRKALEEELTRLRSSGPS